MIASVLMFAGTIVASNYVVMAQLLGESFLRHHPDSRFVILVIDDGPVPESATDLEIWRLSDIDLPDSDLDLMKTVYDVMEFSTAVKPSLLRSLLRHDDVVCYLDPDIFVYAPFSDVVESVRESGIVLTPHVLHPVPRDGYAVSERMIMQSGMFNLGFIGVGRSASAFLDWWNERMLVDAVVDLDAGLFTDQRWVDWVPALFPYQTCRDPGMNIAWWNIHERELDLAEGRPRVGGSAVRFVHFSGYDPGDPDVLSKHQHPFPRTPHEPGRVIRTLAERYGQELIARGHLDRRAEPYRWARSDDGTLLTPGIRKLCRRHAVAELEAGAQSGELMSAVAFGERSSGFRKWLESPGGGTISAPHSIFERTVWSGRPDLRSAFPDVDEADAAAFRTWLDTEEFARQSLGEFWHARPVPATPTDAPRGLVARARTASRRMAQRVVRSFR